MIFCRYSKRLLIIHYWYIRIHTSHEWKLNNNLLHRKEIKKVDNIFKTEIKNDQINNLKKENIKHKDEIIIKIDEYNKLLY